MAPTDLLPPTLIALCMYPVSTYQAQCTQQTTHGSFVVFGTKYQKLCIFAHLKSSKSLKQRTFLCILLLSYIQRLFIMKNIKRFSAVLQIHFQASLNYTLLSIVQIVFNLLQRKA